MNTSHKVLAERNMSHLLNWVVSVLTVIWTLTTSNNKNHLLYPYPQTSTHTHTATTTTTITDPVLSADSLGPASGLNWPFEMALSGYLLSWCRLSIRCMVNVLIRMFEGNAIDLACDSVISYICKYKLYFLCDIQKWVSVQITIHLTCTVVILRLGHESWLQWIPPQNNRKG